MTKPWNLVNTTAHLLDAAWNIDDVLDDCVLSAEDIKTLRTVQREVLNLVKVVDQVRYDNLKATLG